MQPVRTLGTLVRVARGRSWSANVRTGGLGPLVLPLN